MKTLSQYLAGANTLQSLLTQVQSDTMNMPYNYTIAKKYIARWEGENAVPFFRRILKYDPENQTGYHEEIHCYMGIYEARFNKNPDPLEKYMYQTTNPDFIRMSYDYLIRYYKQAEDFNKLTEIFDFGVKKYPDDAGILNDYAWQIYEYRASDRLEKGIAMARRAVEL